MSVLTTSYTSLILPTRFFVSLGVCAIRFYTLIIVTRWIIGLPPVFSWGILTRLRGIGVLTLTLTRFLFASMSILMRLFFLLLRNLFCSLMHSLYWLLWACTPIPNYPASSPVDNARHIIASTIPVTLIATRGNATSRTGGHIKR